MTSTVNLLKLICNILVKMSYYTTYFLIICAKLSHFFLFGSLFLHQKKNTGKQRSFFLPILFYLLISLLRSIRCPHHTQLLKSPHPLESKEKPLKAPYPRGHSPQYLEKEGNRDLLHPHPVLS